MWPVSAGICTIRDMSTPPPSDNIPKVLHRLRLSAKKYQRAEEEILLLAVSKTRPAQDIRQAWSSGQSHFGESYLQEAVEKIAALADLPLTWHFIGPIQSNKTRPIAEHFHWVHSVDREKIARRLNDQRPTDLPPLQVCLQVNISDEQSKSGCTPEQLPALARAVDALPMLQLRGLMAIPAATGEEAMQRKAFARLRRIFEQLQAEFPAMDTLSMGMSGDMEAAIAEGATIVRVGTAIFGPRGG
jgi:PLP dependent protein